MGIGSFFKGLGKGLLKIAPIAASFIPGVGPLASTLIGAGTGAASGAVSGGKKGALIGGLMGGGMAGATSALKNTSFIDKLFGNGGATVTNSGIPSIPVTAGIAGGKLPGELIPLLGAAIKSGDKSFISKIGSLLGSQGKSIVDKILSPEGLEAMGSGAGAISQSSATNRGTALDAMMVGDRNRMDAREQRAIEEKDLWRKIQAANYMKNGGMSQKPAFSSSGAQLPSFGFGPAPISQDDKDMANTLLPQLQDRLRNPLQLSNYESKMEPGKTEKALDWIGPILSGAGAITRGKK